MILRYSFERENFVVFFLHGKEALFIILNYLFKKWLGLSPTTRVFLVTPLTKSPIRDYLLKAGINATIFREGLIRRIWNFLHTYILVSYSLTKIFTIPHWAVWILWISKYRQKSTFSTTLEIHNFWLERDKILKTLLHIEYLLMYLP